MQFLQFANLTQSKSCSQTRRFTFMNLVTRIYTKWVDESFTYHFHTFLTLCDRSLLSCLCKALTCVMTSVSSQPQFRYTQPPSKVLHLRNLPWECTEEELIELGKPFGKVVNTKCNVGANKNQAFIEFVSAFNISLFLVLTH